MNFFVETYIKCLVFFASLLRVKVLDILTLLHNFLLDLSVPFVVILSGLLQDVFIDFATLCSVVEIST